MQSRSHHITSTLYLLLHRYSLLEDVFGFDLFENQRNLCRCSLLTGWSSKLQTLCWDICISVEWCFYTLFTHIHTQPRLSDTEKQDFFPLSSPVQHHSWSMLGSIMLGGCFIEAGAGRLLWVKRETEWHKLSGALRTWDCTKGAPSNKRGQFHDAVFCLVCIVTLMTVWALLYSRDEWLWF